MPLRRFLLSFLCCLPLWCSAAPLPDHEVFRFHFHSVDPDTLKLDWSIKAGYFLYQERIQITHADPNFLRIGTITFPKATIKLAKDGKSIPIYRNKLNLAIPILANSGGEDTITVHYQGCSDAGFCYPPQTRDIQLTFDAQHKLIQAQNADLAYPAPISHPTQPQSSLKVKTLFLTATPAWVLLSFFGFGLLLAFTPCVLPMVPVLSSIIIGQGQHTSTRKAFLLSSIYVLSMAITYGIIGAVIAVLGANLQIVLQSPWVLSAFSLVMVVLALSMFNVYEFRLPLSWQTGLAKVTRSHQSGHYLNAAIMGSMSILVLSPCVTPPLIGALGYIAETGSMWLGLSSLFFLGLGMGTPLLLIGASAGKLLPKAGQWMNTIKYIFGMILLGLAIHLLERILSPLVVMLLWSALFITTGLGLRPFYTAKARKSIVRQAIGLMLVMFGGFILYGASAGHTNPWRPFSAFSLQNKPAYQRIVVTTVAQAQQVLADALAAEQPVLLDFYATWCESCQQIEKTVMQTADLSSYADRIYIVQVDLSKNDAETKALLSYFHVIAPPTFLFYDRGGNALTELQWVGPLDANILLEKIERLVNAE